MRNSDEKIVLLEKSGRHERFSPGKSAISKVQCVLPFQVRQFSKFSNKKRCVNFTHRFASVWSSVSPFQDRFVFFRNRSHCGLKWAGEGSSAEAPVLPSCATHPPLPVSGFFSWELCGYPLAERTHERASPRTARRVSNRRARAFEFVQIKKAFVRFLLSRLSLS